MPLRPTGIQTENSHLQIIHHRSPIENSGSSLKHVCWRRRTPFSAQVHNSSHGSCDFIRRLLPLGLGKCQCWDVSYAPNCFKKNVDSCPQTDEIVSFTYRNLIFVGRLGKLRNMHKSCKDNRVSSYLQAWQCFFLLFFGADSWWETKFFHRSSPIGLNEIGYSMSKSCLGLFMSPIYRFSICMVDPILQCFAQDSGACVLNKICSFGVVV